MVMEAPPSPQSVGREFVRQYYTLLNKAPTHLHRFYNQQSSFVHGGLDPPNRETSPMIGQKQIHQKIQQLNFRDCHAKITQVDAQATLGNGVVVQVTGELSNAGQPMRRFTQTFVLAAQSPKKYYVHNDIFRYQDEIVSDDECEPESRSENEEEVVPDHNVNQLNQQPIPYYSPNNAPLQSNLPPVPQPHLAQPQTVLPPPPIPAVNGAVHPDDINVMTAPPVSQHLPTAQAQGLNVPMGNDQSGMAPQVPMMSTANEEIQQVSSEDQSQLDGSMDNNYSIGQETSEIQDSVQDSTSSNEPKTYATLLKSGSGTPSYANAGNMNQISTFQPQKSVSPPLSQNRYDHRDNQFSGQQPGNQTGLNQRNNSMNRGTRNTPRMPRQDSTRSIPGKGNFNDDGSMYDERRKSQSHGNSFGDNHQLFLGNLPHSATEDELREIFAQFGIVVDLRILSKAGAKGGIAGGHAPPNCGFITYENQQAVQKCLAAKPIYYPYMDINGTTLNVEEKKTKDRASYRPPGNRIGMDNNGQRPRDNNGPRRGPPGTAPRGGMGGTPPSGTMGGAGGRPNSFNRPPNRNPNNTYNNRR